MPTIDFDTVSPWKDRKRVALDNTGTVVGIHSATDTDEWENPDDVSATYKEVDDSVNWSAYESGGLNCMVQVPKFWYKQYKDTDGWHFMISPKPATGFSLHPAFYESDGTTPRDYYYISAFEGWVDGDSKLRSLPNKQPSASTNVTGTFTAFQGYASNVGTGWHLMDWNILWAEQLQFFIEINTLYSQNTTNGYLGVTNLASGTGNHSQNTGHTLDLGNASGEKTISATNGVSGTTYPFSYRGHENLYGNIWKWVDGMVCNLLSGQIVTGGTTYTLDDTTTGHIDPSNFEAGVPGFYPCGPDLGSESTYLTDYLYRANNTAIIPLFGCGWCDGGQAGGLVLGLNGGASHSNRNIGGRAAL